MYHLDEFIEKDFLLFARKKNGEINGMTCGWMTEGRLFNKHVISLFVRKNRYTYEFIDEADEYLISTIEDKDVLSYFGSVSGRDEDKIKVKNLSFEKTDKGEVLAGADRNINLRKICVLDLAKADYLDEEIKKKFREDTERHFVFIGEVMDVK